MAFKTEADRLKYEAEMQAFYRECHRRHGVKSGGQITKAPRTDADRLMAYRDSEVVGRGGVAMILTGIPLLLLPPVGMFFIVSGIISLAYGTKRLNDANPQ